jgi:hypothetical protein
MSNLQTLCFWHRTFFKYNTGTFKIKPFILFTPTSEEVGILLSSEVFYGAIP